MLRNLIARLFGLSLLLASPAFATNSTVANYPAASALGGAELLYCVQAGGDTKCTPAQFATYVFSLMSSDFTVSSGGVATLASVISAAGPIGSATVVPIITYDAKGRLTTVSSTTITPAEASVTFTDITTNNVSTTKHGFAPKLPNDATKYFDGTGAYQTAVSVRANIGLDNRVPGTDANTNIAATTHYQDLGNTNWTTPATYKLPAISGVNDGDTVVIADHNVKLNGQTLTIDVATASGDTLVGATAMQSAGGRIDCRANTTTTTWACWPGITNGTNGQLYVGQTGAPGNWVTPSGAVTVDNLGVFSFVNSQLTNAKMANMNAHTYKGNNTGSAAAPLDLTQTQLTAELNAFVGDSGSGGTKGLVNAPATGDATKFLKGDGTWATPGGSGTVTTSGSPVNGNLAKFSGSTVVTNTDLTGDVTTSGGVATTIANSAVTNAKIAASTIDLTAKVTGALPKANGGTGGTTGAAAATNLSLPYSVCTPTINSALTGGTVNTETVMGYCQIPANLIGTAGFIRVSFVGSATANTNTKTWRIRYGAANDLSGTQITANGNTLSTSYGMGGTMNMIGTGATNAQLWYPPGSAIAVIASAATVATTVDTTAISYVVISGNLTTANTDTMTLQLLRVEFVPLGGN